ncbi:MAG: phosphoribosyltransferase family protein [Bacteroidota bacterium]
MEHKNQILSEDKIIRILRRIAVEIYENNLTEPQLMLVGVHDQGFKIARFIKDELHKIDQAFKVELLELHIDKSQPSDSIRVDWDTAILEGKSVILVDDVLNTSRTLAYCLQFLLATHLSKLETAVLINRSHAQFPISATYSGYELATTLDEHIKVQIEGEVGAYLY